MSPFRRRPFAFGWAFCLGLMLGGFSACSLSAKFEDEGRPCDSSGLCAEGFTCVEGACQALSGNSKCQSCPADTLCDEGSGLCVATTCAARACAVGFTCVEESGTTRCRPIFPPNYGHSCIRDTDCSVDGPNQICYAGTVQQSSGARRPGFCIEKCLAPGAACQTTGATCQSFKTGLGTAEVLLCVTPKLVTACESDAVCTPAGLLCTVFDHPGVGPATFCDSPLSGGAAVGQACSVSLATGALCANGLCIPREPAAGQAATCGQLCGAATCGAGTSCQLVEFRTPAEARFLPMCVAQVTACLSCDSGAGGAAACGADAPRCTTFNGAPRCLAECAPTGGTGSTCPTGYTCGSVDGANRCVPTGNACP